MKMIELTQEKFAFVDDEDFKWLSKRKWYAHYRKHTFVAEANERVNGRNRTIMMHRLIMNAPDGLEVDHKDHNALNNQKYNLRLCTRFENARNVPSRNKKGFRGVYFDKKKIDSEQK
jgi:HNH endonuclease